MGLQKKGGSMTSYIYKVKNYIRGLIRLGALGSLLLASAQAKASQISASSMTVRTGTYDGGLSEILTASDGKILNLYTNQYGNLRVDFKFSTPVLPAKM